MKKHLLFLGLGISILALTGCNNKETQNNNGNTNNDKYVEKEINVYYSNSSEKHNIRNYENESIIPYIGIKDYYKLLLKNTDSKELSDLRIIKDNDIYKIETQRGYDAYINVKENTLYSKNLTNFTNTSSYLKDLPTTSFDGSPYVKVKSLKSMDLATPTLIDFDDYNIDIFGDDNDVYLPIPTLGDIFTGMNLIYSAYNMKDLYIVNGEKEETLMGTFKAYNDDLFTDELNKDYMKYAFNEYCLFFDFFLERTGRTGIEKTYDLSNGLSNALEADEYGRRLKNDLKSTNIVNYCAATGVLGRSIYDGGHTNYSYVYGTTVNGNNAKWFNKDLQIQITERINSYNDSPMIKNSDYTTKYYGVIRKTRKEKLNKENSNLYGEEAYTEFGNIAMISIDDYMTEYYNRDKWLDCYNHKSATIPYGKNEGGAVAALYKGFERAHQNENIKTVIVDLGANTGGSSDEMMYLINFLTGNDKYYYKNQLTDQIIEASFYVDKNLDTKFDDDDINFDPVDDLNVVVLTSSSSFSCGGISPIYLHDLGLKVIGENGGGGSCAIVYRADALGIYNVAGTYFNFVSPKRKANIDYEKDYLCDYFIKKDANNDYSNFYDKEYLTNLINQII